MGSAESEFVNVLKGPGIDSDEAILPAYVSWRAGMSNRAVKSARHAGNRFLGSGVVGIVTLNNT